MLKPNGKPGNKKGKVRDLPTGERYSNYYTNISGSVNEVKVFDGEGNLKKIIPPGEARDNAYNNNLYKKDGLSANKMIRKLKHKPIMKPKHELGKPDFKRKKKG